MPSATQPSPTSLRPPLKWAGGKRWLVPRLRGLWERNAGRRLVEPFCGGLAVALGLGPASALLNDVNQPAINFYRHLQRGLRIRLAMRNDRELFYRHRDDFNRLVTGRGSETRRAAELFYYLNRTGYNGLCRFNRKGEFNVPFGRYDKVNYLRDFTGYAETLTRWTFRDGDFESIPLRPDDFVYADPPYDVEFRQYSQHGFPWEAQIRLAKWLAEHHGPVLLSNQATDRVLELYSDLGYGIEILEAPRMISCNGDRTPAREVLASRNLDQD